MGKVVVITDAGVGVVCARFNEFARKRYNIGLLARDQDRLDRAAKEAREHGI